MKTEVIGSNLDSRYWFRARIVACRESYRRLYGVPAPVNPWAIRARSRVRRFDPEWDGWTPRDAGILVDLLRRDTETHEEDGQYEHIMEYVVCVVAETRSQAHSRAKTCLRNGSFVQFDLDFIETEATTLEATPAATRVMADQTSIHPLIDGEYTPPVPEIHLTSPSDDVAGVVRLELSEAQLREQITRAREHRRRVYDWGRFKPEFELNGIKNERMLAILAAIAEENDVLVGSVSLTDDEPDVAVALVLSHEWVERIQNRATHRVFDGTKEETATWKFPIAESSLDRFLENADTALNTESPRVVGPSSFVGDEDAETISAK